MKDKINRYIWYKDQKMLGTILLITTIAFQAFAWLKIPVLSSIHAYTIGMLVGFYNPIIYAYIAYKALVMIFGDAIKLPKWIKFGDLSYMLIGISIVFIGVSLTFYQSSTGYTSIGAKPWSSFNTWFHDYTDGAGPWVPNNTNGGILGAFLYSFFAMILSGIGALILSIVLAIAVVSYVVTGSVFGFYRQLSKSREIQLKEKEKTAETNLNIETYIEKGRTKTQEKPFVDPETKKDELPFDDPFQ